MGVLLSFQVIIPKMLRQRCLVSLPCTVGLWRDDLLMHLFHFSALALLFTKRKEWFDIYESNMRKYDCMHWATGTFYYSWLGFFVGCNVPSFSRTFDIISCRELIGNLKTYELDKSTVR